MSDRREIVRIQRLAIPPAYEDVWICPLSNGHIQATARDARGRKQYRYHSSWRETRDANKYEAALAFAEALPAIRHRVGAALALPGLPREKVLATVVRLLETTLIRIGNASYARENESYGLTTLRARHVRVDGASLRFRFRGKSGVEHAVAISDKRLARIVSRCRDLPGEELFRYIDDAGAPVPVHSEDVNDYLREITGGTFSAKDFRTWSGTVECAMELSKLEPASSPAEAKRMLALSLKQVARKLGNTAAVCRKCYVHPAVIETYLRDLKLTLPTPRRLARKACGLGEDEYRVLRFISSAVKRARRKPTARLLKKSLKNSL